MRVLAAAALLAISGTILAQPGPVMMPRSEPSAQPPASPAASTGPSVNSPVGATTAPATGTADRGAAQPTGTIQQPDRRPEPSPQQQPQSQQPFGGPVQETGNYGGLGLSSPAGGDGQRSLVQPDHQRTDQQGPSSPERR